jgi:two-component system chemotaxis response regulator CheY
MSNGKLSVLVAEDNPALANVLRFNLQRLDLEVTVALDGARAWQLAQKQSFDVLVTDQEMPGLTGVELVERVRGLDAYQDIPILMVTAREIDLDVKSLKQQYRIAEIVAKPYSPNKLVRMVNEILTTAS